MFTKEDRRIFGKLNTWLNKKLDELANKCDELFDRAFKAEVENMNLRTKVDIYEKLINKMLELNSKPSDEIFMIDGEIYIPIGHTIPANKGERKTAIVEFNCVSDISSLLKKDDSLINNKED